MAMCSATLWAFRTERFPHEFHEVFALQLLLLARCKPAEKRSFLVREKGAALCRRMYWDGYSWLLRWIMQHCRLAALFTDLLHEAELKHQAFTSKRQRRQRYVCCPSLGFVPVWELKSHERLWRVCSYGIHVPTKLLSQYYCIIV